MREAAALLLTDMDTRDVACPVCGGADFETLATQDRYRMGIHTVGCNCCGLILTNPQPTLAAIESFYANSYRQFYQSVDVPTDEYISKLHKDRRAQAVASHVLGALSGSQIHTIADVGCAEGSLLKALSSRLPKAACFGVEVNAPFAEFARTYTGASIMSSIDQLPTGRFNLITLNHVLEHIGEPEAYLRALAPLLASGGLLYLAVPDAASYGGLRDLHIAHLFHYTTVSLARLLQRSNYSVVRMEITQPPNHPTTIAIVARVEPDASAPTISLDTTGWKNVRRADRYALLFHLRRNGCVRKLSSIVKSVARS